MTLAYPTRLKLALTPTPLEYMPLLSEHFAGPNLWFKRDDLTGCALSGNKIRKLEFSLAEARSQEADVVITAGGVQSNHCRATALACAKLGFKCHLVLRGSSKGPADGNLLLDYLAGARVSFYTPEIYSTRKDQIVEELKESYRKEGLSAYYIPVGASNAVGSWGYIRAFEEIMVQCRRQRIDCDHIVCSVGSGGTLAGLIAGRALLEAKKPTLWGVNVCDDAESFRTDIRLILDELNSKYSLGLKKKDTPINILDGYVGQGYAIPYPEIMELIALTGRLEGQILDPVYTAKGLYGLQQETGNRRFAPGENVIFIHTGGVFGLFPQKQDFSFHQKKRRSPSEKE